MRRHQRAHHGQSRTAGDASENGCPLLSSGIRCENTRPFIGIAQKDAWVSAATCRSSHTIPVQEKLISPETLEMSGHVLQPDTSVGHNIVEVAHEFRLRKGREFVKGLPLETS